MLLLCKNTGPASFTFLERLIVEAFQSAPDRFVKVRKGQELPVAERSKDVSGDNTDGSFDRRFISRGTHSRRNDSCFVMLCQFLVGFIQDNFMLAVFLHAGLQVVALDHARYTAKETVGVYMGLCPGFLVH